MLEARPGGGQSWGRYSCHAGHEAPGQGLRGSQGPQWGGVGGVDRGSGLQAALGVQSSNPGLAYACLRLGFLPVTWG